MPPKVEGLKLNESEGEKETIVDWRTEDMFHYLQHMMREVQETKNQAQASLALAQKADKTATDAEVKNRAQDLDLDALNHKTNEVAEKLQLNLTTGVTDWAQTYWYDTAALERWDVNIAYPDNQWTFIEWGDHPQG